MKEMVSIVIPTYNREKEVARAIQSIWKQTYNQYEIIVVDDGSTDRTGEVIRSLGDNRIRYIRLAQNRGPAYARNVGIREAKYEYIAFLDSDDEWLPDKLSIQMDKMLNSPEEVGLVYCRMGGLSKEENYRYVCPHQNMKADILEGDIFRLLLKKNVIGTPSMLFRRKCLEQSGGFKEALGCLEDWELVLRVAQKWKIGFVDEVLVEVYKSDESVSTRAAMYCITRSYMVSRYRKEMTEFGLIHGIKTEIMEQARSCGIYAEIGELLNRDFEL